MPSTFSHLVRLINRLFITYLENINFILIFENNDLRIAELDNNGRPFPHSDFLHIKIEYPLNFSNPIAFDFSQQRMFVIEKSVLIGLDEYHNSGYWIHHELYSFNSTIIWISYDGILNYLFYLNSNNELYILSLTSGYTLLISDQVSSAFKYFDDSSISFLTLDNRICYGKIHISINCVQGPENVQKYIHVKENPPFHIIHFVNDSLAIFDSHTSENLSQPIMWLHMVVSFDVLGDNLYYFQQGVLFLINLYQIDKVDTVSLIGAAQCLNILVHKRESKNDNYLCHNSKCRYFCYPFIDSRNKCICPGNSKLTNKRSCSCNSNNSNCLAKWCLGFYCLNNKCLIDNVRCNGKNDCGDNSDEYRCNGNIFKFNIVTCTNGTHLCGGLCVTSNLICLLLLF
ncbi:hypothetical protein MXB_330 [Myxobolus squamalis]|nr:hypothetical protein MXB_330 [Myxobolus squamalis]